MLFLFHDTVMTASAGTAIRTSPVKHTWAGDKGIDRRFQKLLLEEAHLLLDLPVSVFCRAPQGGGAAPFHAPFFFLALSPVKGRKHWGSASAVYVDTVEVWCRTNSACPSPWFEWMRGVAANPFTGGTTTPVPSECKQEDVWLYSKNYLSSLLCFYIGKEKLETLSYVPLVPTCRAVPS